MEAIYELNVFGVTEVQAEELLKKFTEAAEAMGGIVGGGMTVYEGDVEVESTWTDLEALATKVKDLEAKLKAKREETDGQQPASS